MTNQPAAHEPITLIVGTLECLDRECDEYFTADGDDDPGVERCSHIREETVCAECSTERSEEFWDPTVAWADCPERKVAVSGVAR